MLRVLRWARPSVVANGKGRWPVGIECVHGPSEGLHEPPQAWLQHCRVNLSAKVYVQGNVHTNTIEGFWSLLKNGIRGAHHAVGASYLQSYVNEYAFRYNHRDDKTPMFTTLKDRTTAVQHGRYGEYAPIGEQTLSREIVDRSSLTC